MVWKCYVERWRPCLSQALLTNNRRDLPQRPFSSNLNFYLSGTHFLYGLAMGSIELDVI